jgi:3-phenylpropionate/trans-cinnamate dioxygenase ferredoxin subunit
MATLVEAGEVNDLKDGEMKDVVQDGHEILLARVGGKYYAADNRCPHYGGKLARGKLEGTIVTCPLHGSQFDLASGKVVRWLKGFGLLSSVGKALKGPRPISTYKVKVESDKILVEI